MDSSVNLKLIISSLDSPSKLVDRSSLISAGELWLSLSAKLVDSSLDSQLGKVSKLSAGAGDRCRKLVFHLCECGDLGTNSIMWELIYAHPPLVD